MKIALLFAALFCAATVLAETPFPSAAPNLGNLDPTEIETAKLPSALKDVLLGYDSFQIVPDKLPDVLSILLCDLNGDSKPEYIISERSGYSGGPMMHIFSSEASNFKDIGSFQGGFYLADRKNGYSQIVSTARAGGGVYTRCLYSFRDGSYRLDRIADYKILDNDREEYLEDRDPTPFNDKSEQGRSANRWPFGLSSGGFRDLAFRHRGCWQKSIPSAFTPILCDPPFLPASDT